MLGTVGEPINPEAWLWYYRVVGEERCPIVDTFWQTETVSPCSVSRHLSVPCAPCKTSLQASHSGVWGL